MKNKFLSLIFASCLIVPGAFALTACGEPDCEHDWRVMRMPTVHGTGATACMKCGQDGMVFPALNETDYTVSGTNPDYRLYSYVTDDETYEFYHSNFEVTYDNNLNGYSICDYLGTSSSVVIPQTITSHEGEFSVVSIRDEAFADNTAIISVVLPDGIKELSGGAFKGCTNLSSINLPDGLTAIDNYALSQTKLSEIVVPGSVTRIGNFLENCEYVEKLSIPFV
ncbi:MAG: leucine-rich repeat domain-containing protein, partial [Clostridia bacterium]|nr:leucine-rich repeat domain-containing protein [Clostridia bacterium]